MEETFNYKNLFYVTYYSLIALVVTITGLFLWRMTSAGVHVAVQVIYYIWGAFLIFVALADIYCSMLKVHKKCIGYSYLVIAWAAIIMAIVLFFVLNLNTNLTFDNEMLYAGLISLCFIPTILGIVEYLMGFKYYKIRNKSNKQNTNM